MSHDHQAKLNLSMNPVALSSYSVSACAFAASALGLVVSHLPSGGLAAVGAFYLVVGLLSPNPSKAVAGQSIAHPIGGATSGADNLVAEPVAGSRSRDLVGASR